MLLDSGYFQAAGHRHQRPGCLALGGVPAMTPEVHPAGSPDVCDDSNPFHALYLRSTGTLAVDVDMSDDRHGLEGDDGGLSDAMSAMEAPLLELDTPLDAPLDSKSLFVDAFQYWRHDGDADASFSSTPDLSPHVVAVKTEPVAGGLPHMIPGSARFAAPDTPPAVPPPSPESILLHTGANVVDMVSGVTCSGVGLGALGRDVMADFAHRAPHRAFGNQQGNFGHLLRQRPASVGGEVRHTLPTSLNQAVVRQRPHSEDLQGLRVLRGAEDADGDLEEDDYDDDDVFLASDVHAVAVPTVRRQRLSSSGHSNEDCSDEDDVREEGADGPEGPGGAVECRWSECGLQFAGRAPLVRHIEKVHVEPRRGEDFSCLWRCCPRGARPFNARYKLLIHMRVHSGEKPNKCPFPGCPKAFSRLENLKIHQRSHTGERPYCCQFAGCNKAFSNSSDRAKHQRTHFDTKPYACQVPGCAKRYTDPSSLRKHVKNHSGKDLAHAQVRRAGSTGSTADSEASLSSESSQFSRTAPSEALGYNEHYADVTLDDAMSFPSADDIDQAIREFIPFEEVDKYITEPNGVSAFDLHEPLEFDFDPNFWNCPA